jgi:adenosylcobinamide-phosphate synthase
MDLAALILVLLIEQGRAVPHRNPVWDGVRETTAWFARNFNAGQKEHGRTAWVLYVGAALIFSGALWWLAHRIHPMLGFALNVVFLVFTMGFRQFSHHFTVIEEAVRNNDVDTARKALAQWRRERELSAETALLTIPQIAGAALEEGLVASHRAVFGTIFWFALLPGPLGAVLYRLTEHIARSWNRPEVAGTQFGKFASDAFELLDWAPARLSALAFAIVGNFEDAMHLWRNRAVRFGTDTRALLIATGAGALGVELGRAIDPAEQAQLDWTGAEPGAPAMRSAVGLIWRATVLWLTLIALWTVAQLFS